MAPLILEWQWISSHKGPDASDKNVTVLNMRCQQDLLGESAGFLSFLGKSVIFQCFVPIRRIIVKNGLR